MYDNSSHVDNSNSNSNSHSNSTTTTTAAATTTNNIDVYIYIYIYIYPLLLSLLVSFLVGAFEEGPVERFSSLLYFGALLCLMFSCLFCVCYLL